MGGRGETADGERRNAETQRKVEDAEEERGSDGGLAPRRQGAKNGERRKGGRRTANGEL